MNQTLFLEITFHVNFKFVNWLKIKIWSRLGELCQSCSDERRKSFCDL